MNSVAVGCLEIDMVPRTASVAAVIKNRVEDEKKARIAGQVVGSGSGGMIDKKLGVRLVTMMQNLWS